jgi:hypothetical protein
VRSAASTTALNNPGRAFMSMRVLSESAPPYCAPASSAAFAGATF